MPHGGPDWSTEGPLSTVYSIQDMAELAVRLGSIVTFDRRGNVLWMDDFESGIEAWGPRLPGADYFSWVPNHHAGGFCARMATRAVANDHNYMGVYVPYPVLSKMGFEFSFRRDTNLKWIYLDVWFLSGTIFTDTEVKWTAATKTWSYLGADNAEHDLSPTVNLEEDLLFHTVKLVGDYVNGKYVRLIVDNVIYNMTDLEPYATGSPVGPYILIIIGIRTESDDVAAADIDNVIITQNEP